MMHTELQKRQQFTHQQNSLSHFSPPNFSNRVILPNFRTPNIQGNAIRDDGCFGKLPCINNSKSESVIGKPLDKIHINIGKYILVPKMGENGTNSLNQQHKKKVNGDSSASGLVQGTRGKGSKTKKRTAAMSALDEGTHKMPSSNRTEKHNEFTEKVKDETQIMDSNGPLWAQKRRLILTTQLTQQLIPSNHEYLKSDARLGYENIIYHVARSAMAEACSLLSPKDDCSFDFMNEDRIFQKSKTQESEQENSLSKNVEDIIKRSQILEGDFARLDERSLMLDVRSECHQLETIIILNRLTKFQAPNQNYETTLQVQRHVTASRSQMDTNTPLTVPCLSL